MNEQSTSIKKDEPLQDNDEGLSNSESRLAGALLIIFTLFPALMIIGFWPDRLPGPKEDIKPLYKLEFFHTRLAGICSSISYEEASALIIDTLPRATGKSKMSADTTKDTGSKKSQNSAKPVGDNQPVKLNADVIKVSDGCITVADESKYIHINTLLLLLVALAGFLGNMVHIATSFTTFLASGKFYRSWLLWYCVRPFTAAALAVGIYFVFRGGFLNMSGDAAVSINLYGVMTISLLTGLFTDRATQKLKEVFDVLFKPAEERPNKMEDDLKISGVTPDEIETGKENMIIIKGKHLDTKKFTVKINDEPVNIAGLVENEATIKYPIPASQQGKTSFELVALDETNKKLFTKTLTLKSEPPPGPQPNPNPVPGIPDAGSGADDSVNKQGKNGEDTNDIDENSVKDEPAVK